MATPISTTTNESVTIEQTEQASVVSKDSSTYRLMDIKIIRNVLLIWLHSNTDDKNNTDCRNTIKQLQSAFDTVHTFTDIDKCIQFLEHNNDEHVSIIISGSLGKYIMRRIHDLPQVDAIFIFSENKQHYERWIKEWSKTRGVFTDITIICEAIKQTTKYVDYDNISISFIETVGNTINQRLDQLDCSFMYTQILKEILLTIDFNQEHMDEFIQYCRVALDGNNDQLKYVDKLEREYHQETPIEWCTCQCFLYPMVNRALQLMDIDVMIKMGFFIKDLHHHIERLYREQLGDRLDNNIFTVYHGQGMSKTDFEQLRKTQCGLISFNNFLSTNKSHEISLSYVCKTLEDPNSVGVIFVMTIDPAITSIPYASMTDVSGYKMEKKVVFSMHTVFRIQDIQRLDDKPRLYQVNLILTSDNDSDLCKLTDRIREEAKGTIGWSRLGEFLIKVGQFDKAKQVYEVLLAQKTTDQIDKGYVYNQLGKVKYRQGQYQEALAFGEKALDILSKTHSPNSSETAKSHNLIGSVYDSMGDHSKALSSYVKALQIRQKSSHSNHPDIAESYNNLGAVYSNMCAYSQALHYYELDLKITQKILPWNHPDLATSYSNIGNVYYRMGDYSKALPSYEKALEISQQSLPSNHPDLATSYSNIGTVYYHIGDYSKALPAHEKALEIREKSLPSNHSDLATSYNNIGLVYEEKGDCSNAQSFYQRAVDIVERSLGPHHPTTKTCRKNLDIAKSNSTICCIL